MSTTITTAYHLDDLVSEVKELLNMVDISNQEISKQLTQIRKLTLRIAPQKESEFDKVWEYWIPLPRGNYKDFLKEQIKRGEDPEGLDDELKWYWDAHYPEKNKWFRLGLVSSYKDTEIFLSFSEFSVFEDKDKQLRGVNKYFNLQIKLLKFIKKQLAKTINLIIQDPGKYNRWLEKNLSKRNRFGRIKRKEYWENDKEAYRPDKILGKTALKSLARILPDIIEGRTFDKMTANTFFRLCEIGYDSNNYFKNEKSLSAKDKYKRKADMRDEGLTKIRGNSVKAFYDWYHGKRFGGHPWEICRGGNTTHISLYVSEKEDKTWHVILAGSSLSRVVETVKMALALHKENIPFQLAEAKEILHMLTGEDYVGIVPHRHPTRYCGSCFPEEDNIIGFMDPWFDEDLASLGTFIYWYPLKPYLPKSLKT